MRKKFIVVRPSTHVPFSGYPGIHIMTVCLLSRSGEEFYDFAYCSDRQLAFIYRTIENLDYFPSEKYSDKRNYLAQFPATSIDDALKVFARDWKADLIKSSKELT